jgi:hypothetical protein
LLDEGQRFPRGKGLSPDGAVAQFEDPDVLRISRRPTGESAVGPAHRGTLPYKITTDGPVTVTLPDTRVLGFTAAGTYEGVLAAVAHPAPAAAPAPLSLPVTGDDGRLPATGATAPVAAGAVLLALFLVARRCAS